MISTNKTINTNKIMELIKIKIIITIIITITQKISLFLTAKNIISQTRNITIKKILSLEITNNFDIIYYK